jgi:hypothetical protein
MENAVSRHRKCFKLLARRWLGDRGREGHRSKQLSGDAPRCIGSGGLFRAMETLCFPRRIRETRFRLVVEGVGAQRVRAQNLHVVAALERARVRHGTVTHAAAHLLDGAVFVLIQPAIQLG